MLEITLHHPVMRGYLFCSAVLVAKVLFMVYFTGRARFSKKVFMNPEDLPLLKKWFGIKDPVCKYDDKDVQRILDAHLNDLQNITVFIFIGFIYVLTQPDPSMAVNIFKTYTWCRIIYTISIAALIPQSVSDISCVVGYLLTVYMTLVCMFKFF